MIKIKKPEKRKKFINMSLTQSEYNQIVKIAKRNKMSAGGFSRALILQQIESEVKRGNKADKS